MAPSFLLMLMITIKLIHSYLKDTSSLHTFGDGDAMSVFIVVGHSIFIVVQYLSLNFQTMMVVGPTTIDNTNNDTNNDMIVPLFYSFFSTSY